MKDLNIKYDFTQVVENDKQPMALMNAELCIRLIENYAESLQLKNQAWILRNFRDALRRKTDAADPEKILDVAIAFMKTWISERELIDAIIHGGLDQYLVKEDDDATADPNEVAQQFLTDTPDNVVDKIFSD